MSLPKVGKDANGLPILIGVEERQLTQAQADYSDTLKAAELVTGPQGDKLRALLRSNPTASAGLMTSLAKAGAMPNNTLVNNLVELDKQTKIQRELDIKKESNRISTENFNERWYGKLWTGFKGLSRNVAVIGSTPLEIISSPMRQAISDVRAKRAGEEVDESAFAFYKNVATKTPEQSTLFQATKQLIQEGKVDLGAGFFPSEEIGAGFKARQAQMKVAKQSFQVNGKTYYRPYSIFDPLATVVTSATGDTEGTTARFITAIGDIGVSVALDPFLAVSKLREAERLGRLVAEGSKGFTAAKASKEASLLKAQLDEAIARTEKSLKAVHGAGVTTKAAKTTTYLNNYRKQMKLQDEFKNVSIDYDGIATFLSGAGGEHIIDTIANIDDWQQIQKLSRGNLTVKEAVALSRATTREEVLAAIAPYIANGEVVQGSLELGNKTTRALSKLVKGSTPKVMSSATGAVASAITRTPYLRQVLNEANELFNWASNKYNAFVPDADGTLVHINDTDKLVEVVNNVARKLNLDDVTIKGLLDEIALSDDSVKAGYAATGKLFDKVFEAYAKKANYTPEQLKALENATRVFKTERDNTAAFWAEQHATGTDIEFMVSGGKLIKVHSSHLDSELLNSFVWIPSGDEVTKFLGEMSKFKYATNDIIDVMSTATGWWKKSVMVRPAYITRNIAEEQIRVFASGHISFFNSPLAAIAMTFGREDGYAWQRVLNKFDTVRNDVFDSSWKMAKAADEIDAETAAMDLINPYADFMGDAFYGASGDGEMNKIIRNLGYTKEVYGHPLWWGGFASQMRILHNSDFVQRVLATGPSKEAQLRTVNYFLKGGGRKTLERFAGSKEEAAKKMLMSKEGLLDYLFTGINSKGESVSVLARIEELAGAGGKSSSMIKKLLADGEVTVGQKTLKIPGGKEMANNAIENSRQVSKGRRALDDANKIFAKDLEEAFAGTGNWDNIRLTVPNPSITGTRAKKQTITDAVNWFFDVSTKFEKISTMGPEWRQSYWDAVNRIIGSLDEDAIAQLGKTAKNSLGPLRNPITGENIGRKHPVWESLKYSEGKGNVTLEEAHKYASTVANRKVTNLFYNAGKRRLLFHQLRLVAPFAQAWENTIRAWGNLAMENPMQVYKVGKAINFAESSASSVLYELTDAKDYYDPSQGFFYKDPNTEERKFFVPLAGAGINLLTRAATGGRVGFEGPFAMSATPQSFNFALGGGSIMPGFGPGVSISAAVLDSLDANPMKLLPAGLEEEIYRVAFPYGTPDIKNNGLLETAFLSSNWTRIFGGIINQEYAFAGAFPATMTYLANSGDYNIDVPEDQVRLAADSTKLAKWFTIWRGMTGALSPIPFSLRPEALAKSKDGDTVLATSLWADFKNLEKASGSNRNKAYADFLDTYGPEQIFAIIKTTSGFEPTNLPTYNLIKKDPSVMNKYSEVYGMFYPNGELSQVLYRYHQQRGAFEKMSAEDIMKKATQIRYYAALDRLNARSVAEGWDSSQLKEAKTSVTKAYGQRDLTFDISTGKQTKWERQLRAATQDENLADSEAVVGLTDYMYLRDKVLAELDKVGLKTLNNATSEPQRAFLAEQAGKIIERNPDFQKIFYAYFKRELEG
jgi:hypothetical protein